MIELVRDISAIDYTARVTVEQPLDLPFLEEAKRTTNARICVGKAGTALRTETMLRYLADHAAANDAVWAHVDESFFEAQGFLRLATLAPDKEAYLKRPDLGRDFPPGAIETLKASCPHGVQVQVVVGDGLSACAVEKNLPDLYPVLMEGIGLKGWSVGRPVFVRHARVATMDKISVALDAEVTVLLIGHQREPQLLHGLALQSGKAGVPAHRDLEHPPARHAPGGGGRPDRPPDRDPPAREEERLRPAPLT
jgi:ethanolamine ammonia-lyase small subunit